MMQRNALPARQRIACSRLVKIAHDKPFIIGGLVRMARVCGVRGCKCNRGQKHVSSYLSLRYENKRQMIYVPRELERYAEYCLENYRDIKETLEVISTCCVERVIKSKKKRIVLQKKK